MKIHGMLKTTSKIEVVRIQVAIPIPLYEDVKKLLEEQELSWQSILLAAIKVFQIECAEEKNNKKISK